MVAVPAAAAALLIAADARSASSGNLTLAPNQPKQESTITRDEKSPVAGRAAQSDPALLGRRDSTPLRILVKLAYDPVSSYGGGLPGLAATSPAKTGKKLSQNKAAVDAYTEYTVAYEAKVLDRIRKQIPTAKVEQRYRAVYGGVAMTLPANRIGDLLAIDGVVAVQADTREHIDPAK
jgi:hypothetical protein